MDNSPLDMVVRKTNIDNNTNQKECSVVPKVHLLNHGDRTKHTMAPTSAVNTKIFLHRAMMSAVFSLSDSADETSLTIDRLSPNDENCCRGVVAEFRSELIPIPSGPNKIATNLPRIRAISI